MSYPVCIPPLPLSICNTSMPPMSQRPQHNIPVFQRKSRRMVPSLASAFIRLGGPDLICRISSHIDWHLEAGLAVVFSESPSANIAGPQSQIQTPDWKTLCQHMTLWHRNSSKSEVIKTVYRLSSIVDSVGVVYLVESHLRFNNSLAQKFVRRVVDIHVSVSYSFHLSTVWSRVSCQIRPKV